MADRLIGSQISQALKELNSKTSEVWRIEINKLFKTFIFEDFAQAFGYITRLL